MTDQELIELAEVLGVNAERFAAAKWEQVQLRESAENLESRVMLERKFVLHKVKQRMERESVLRAKWDAEHSAQVEESA